MPWQLLITISVIGTSAITLFQRALLRQQKYDPVAYSIFFLAIATIFMFSYAAMSPARQVSVPIPYINILISSLLYGVAVILVFKALKKITASQFAILYSTRAAWTALLAVPLLSESLTTAQVVGAAFVLLAVYILNPIRKRSLQFDKNSLLVLLAALLYGIAFVNDAIAVRGGYSVPLYVALATIGPMLVIILLQPSVLQKLKPLFRNIVFIKTAIITGFLHALQAITIYLAFQRAHNAPVLAMLNQLQTVLIVLGGIILLGEREQIKRKLFSTAVGFAGLVLLVI